jgi:hypothetical protein
VHIDTWRPRRALGYQTTRLLRLAGVCHHGTTFEHGNLESSMSRKDPQHQSFVGNYALYILLAQRQPLFLQRNLRQVLHYFYKRQPRRGIYEMDPIMKSAHDALIDAPQAEMEPSSPARENWTTEELTHILSKGTFGLKDPILIVHVTSIKDRLAKFRYVKEEAIPLHKDTSRRIRATCSLTIWDSRLPNDDTLIEQTRKCEIHPLKFASDERGATVIMDKPFIVQLHQLRTEKLGRSTSTAEVQLSMQIVVMVAEEDDLWPPVEMKLPTPKTAPYRDTSGLVKVPVLVAKWHRLPKCPEGNDESILELTASQDGNQYKPKLGLKIDANWHAAGTPLETANLEMREGSCKGKTHKSSTSEPFAYINSMDIALEWTFKCLKDSIRPMQIDKFCCPFCSMKDFHDPMQLHFHLLNSHPYFKFTFTLHFESRRVRGNVEVNLADNYDHGAKSTDLLKDLEIDWEKPKALLELDAYFKGDESWLGKKTRRTENLLMPVLQAPSTSHSPRSRSKDISKLTVLPPVIVREGDKVPDMPAATKRRFRVPKAPNQHTRFFRLTTKRPLVEGEMVSESDDDIDDEWILRKHEDTIDSFADITREEKLFMQRFDRHMLSEDVSSDLHSSEAIIRFCRINGSWLKTRSMRFEFHKKVATLRSQGCITFKTIWDCMKIIDDSVPKKDPDAMDIDMITENLKGRGNHTPEPVTLEIGDMLGRCAICFCNITHPRSHLYCANPVCLPPREASVLNQGLKEQARLTLLTDLP